MSVTDASSVAGARMAALIAEESSELGDVMRRAASGDAVARRALALMKTSGWTLHGAAERRLRRQAAETAEWCGQCGRDLDPHEPVWNSGDVLGECCRPAETAWLWDRALADYRQISAYELSPAPCEACGRPVYVRVTDPDVYGRSSRYRVTCCERCRLRALAVRRRTGRAALRDGQICDVCGDDFDPPRSDARYCSNRCRQKAYRARKNGGDRS